MGEFIQHQCWTEMLPWKLNIKLFALNHVPATCGHACISNGHGWMQVVRNFVIRGPAKLNINHRVVANKTGTLVPYLHILPKQMTTTTAAVNAARFLADRNAPLCSLSVKDSFAQLTEKEKQYAHWVGTAAWAGARITQEQWTPQAQSLYNFLICVFSSSDAQGIADLGDIKSKSGLNEEEWTQLLEYVAQVVQFSSRFGH
jgi:hypothetical protein